MRKRRCIPCRLCHPSRMAAPFTSLTPFADTLRVTFFSKISDTMEDAKVGAAFGDAPTAALHQVHSDRVIRTQGPIARTEEGDGLCTDIHGLVLTIRTADCQPILLYAPKRRVVGLVHAGWRGLLKGVIPAAFILLREEWGIAGDDVTACIGPSLCTNCAEFSDPARELPGIDPRFFRGRRADLRAIADMQLRRCGVTKIRIERHGDCTRCRPDLYWTYRGGHREAVQAGHANVLACMLLPR